MDYNTSLGGISFREYGRNIQKLVNHAKTIENKYERTIFARAIINLMGQMHPHLRNIDEFRSKLWTQLYVMADFDLDVDSPYPIPAPEEVHTKPNKVNYPQSKLKFRHYGKNVEQLIAKAIKMEEGPKKKAFVRVIANYMKMVYKNWNRETVSDEIIKNDLAFLSGDELFVPDNVDLDATQNKYNSSGRSGGAKRKKDYDGGGHRGGRGGSNNNGRGNGRHRGGGGRGGSNNYHSNNNNYSNRRYGK